MTQISKRFEIGTMGSDGVFKADTISNDPTLTTFDTLEQAITEIQDVIAHAVEMWGEPMDDGAVWDSEENEVAWQQVSAW